MHRPGTANGCPCVHLCVSASLRPHIFSTRLRVYSRSYLFPASLRADLSPPVSAPPPPCLPFLPYIRLPRSCLGRPDTFLDSLRKSWSPRGPWRPAQTSKSLDFERHEILPIFTPISSSTLFGRIYKGFAQLDRFCRSGTHPQVEHLDQDRETHGEVDIAFGNMEFQGLYYQ
jgi:hypothetical protein